MPKKLFWFTFTALFYFILPVFAAESIKNDECLTCHDKLNAKVFENSVHGMAGDCVSCHEDIKEIPHADKLKPVNCASCHESEWKIYFGSDHAKNLKGEPSASACLRCHGDPHTIIPVKDADSPVYRSHVSQVCGSCHEDQKKMDQFGLSQTKPVTSYLDTVHGKAISKGILEAAVCTDCHGAHDISASNNPGSRTYWLNVPKTCAKCHAEAGRLYERGIHAKAVRAGKREAPVCTDCHGEHNILSHKDPASTVHGKNVSEKTCSHCHSAERIAVKYHLPSDRLKTYLNSYHGMASKMGVTTVANCASCHNAHDILPSKDPASSVNHANLAKTCGQCHANAGEQLAMASVHSTPSPEKDKVVYFVTIFYIALIILVLGGMVIHNLIDFIAHLRRDYLKHKHEMRSTRFTLSEIIQHAVLFGAFTVLAYSGFALKYSDAWWAVPFKWFNTTYDLRGVIHRAAAIIFTVLGAYHILYALFTRRGRQQLAKIAPAKKDLKDFSDLLLYNLGRSDKRPRFHKYSYIEKAEYWALIWGSLVMVFTGGLLVFENVILRFFEKWVLDVATAVHFYEAILATSAIVIWHFYFVIFHPDYYPMNWSMFTGKGHEDPDEKTPKKPPQEPPKEV